MVSELRKARSSYSIMRVPFIIPHIIGISMSVVAMGNASVEGSAGSLSAMISHVIGSLPAVISHVIAGNRTARTHALATIVPLEVPLRVEIVSSAAIGVVRLGPIFPFGILRIIQ